MTAKNKSCLLKLRPITMMLLFVSTFLMMMSSANAAYTFEQLNSSDNHKWTDAWGTGVTLDYGNYQGADCLRITAAGSTAPITISDYGTAAGGLVSPEDWTDVTQMMLDVYVEGSNCGVAISIQNTSYGQITAPEVNNIAANGWENDLVFDTTGQLSTATNVGRLVIMINSLSTGQMVYIKNLRIVKGGVTYPWDAFDAPSYEWIHEATDYNAWTSTNRCEIVSNSVTASGSAGALYLPWAENLGADTEAKIRTINMQGLTDLSSVNEFRFKVYSDNASVPVIMGFDDGSAFAGSSSYTVSATNTWETVSFTPPSGVDYSALDRFSFHALTNGLTDQSGNIFIDDIEFVVYTATPTITLTPTYTRTPTATPTVTLTPTESLTPTTTWTLTATPTVTLSPTESLTPTISATATLTSTVSLTPTISATYTLTPTESATFTYTPTGTATPTITSTLTGSPTPSITMTIVLTPEPTETPEPTMTFTVTPTLTNSPVIPDSFDIKVGLNSFNPALEQVLPIEIGLGQPEHVTVTVYNRLGRKIIELVDVDAPAGSLPVTWDGKDDSGNVVASGVYVIYVNTDSSQEKKLVAVIK